MEVEMVTVTVALVMVVVMSQRHLDGTNGKRIE